MKLLLAVAFALLLAVPAIAQEQAIHGYVNYDDHNANRLYITTDDGRPVTVDLSTARSSPNGRRSGEAVLVYGSPTGATEFKASQVVADRDRGQATTGVPAGWQTLHGRVEQVSGSRVLLRADDGRVLTVDTSQVAANIRQVVQPGDVITVTGDANAQTPQLFTARFIQSDRTTGALAQSSGGNVQGGWQTLHGQVQSVSGNTMTLRADDGRTITVDMAQVNPNVQRALTQNEGVEVIGHYPSGNQQRLIARWIQQDSSNPSRGGRVVGSSAAAPVANTQAPPPPPPAANKGKVDEKAWQRIHGRVEAVQGTTLRLKADDGRMITVDMSKVAAGVQKGLTAGEPVTVIGHYDNNRNHVDAQYIQQEKAGGAASPKTGK